ncbi:MAG: hypothetical protein PHH98_01605 [Candidatus Gracilibacteria bacterium]|nr:hypothetical protein [Candidatus Gracilibacteria bacterium]
MQTRDLKELEKISDYSIALMDEIYQDIEKLSEHSQDEGASILDSINKKIELARKYSVNVESLNKQILEFRLILFRKLVENKIIKIKKYLNKFSFDLRIIEGEYNNLKIESEIDKTIIDKLMIDVKNEVIKGKIIFMIKDYSESEGVSIYNVKEIIEELEKAKEKGIDVKDIENMILE